MSSIQLRWSGIWRGRVIGSCRNEVIEIIESFGVMSLHMNAIRIEKRRRESNSQQSHSCQGGLTGCFTEGNTNERSG